MQQRENSTKERTVCSMYNLYLNFIALKTLTSSEEEYTNLTSNQIIVKSVMDSSYLWVCVYINNIMQTCKAI